MCKELHVCQTDLQIWLDSWSDNKRVYIQIKMA